MTLIRRAQLLSATFLTFFWASLPKPAQAAPVWTATFEAGDLSEWMPGINETNAGRMNVEVLGEQVYTGQFAGKITVHPDDLLPPYNQNRVDIQHQSTLTAEGADSWISGHYMMLEDAKVRNEIAFYESNNSYTNVMDFWVEPKPGGGTNIKFGVGFLGATLLWTGDFLKGAWHQVAIHVHWSTNAQMGAVDVWFDGQQVVTDSKAKTKADGNTLFFQTGLHRKDPSDNIETLYIDDFIEADNMVDAMIGAPMMAMGGAGGAGAGGTSNTGGTGGAATGGSAMGGTAAGGTMGVGGSATAGSGGTLSTGGTVANNGGTSTGGTTTSTGGTFATGGTIAAGGTATAQGGAAGSMQTAAPAVNSKSGCSFDLRGHESSSWMITGFALGAALMRRRWNRYCKQHTAQS